MGDSTFAEHVATTNSRLASLRANLIDPLTFPESCSELTKWCQDQRAFATHFEPNLMSALEVAMEYGTRENYDYMLTHGLVGACFSHRKHLSKESAARIGRWYEQMRRLKKNGGKRKRAPPKPKEPPVTSPPSTIPLTSPCPLPPPLPPLPLSSGGLAPSNGGQQPPTENNNFMFSPTTNSDGSMWPPQVVPMSQPGSSAGHMPPGANGGAAPYPGQMNPSAPPPHPGMGGYPGQMQLPYGQMEGNHAMYDHRMMAANRAAAAAAAAGGRPQGMMPDYTQMPMGQNPQNPMMRMPVQYPQGHPQMAAHPQMQFGQMMRAPPVSVYGQMTHAQQYAVTAHPNPAQQQPVMLPELQNLYSTMKAFCIERELLSEGQITLGTTGVEAMINPDAYGYLEQNPECEVILSVWQSVKSTEPECHFDVYVNGHVVMNTQTQVKAVGIKKFLRSGINQFQFGYFGATPLHSYSCDFVSRRTPHEMRRILIGKRYPEAQQQQQQQRTNYIQMAGKRAAGFLALSLNCAITKKRMFTPARHNDCKKFTFDLGNLLSANQNKTRYYCNACNVHFKFDDINLDYLLLNAVVAIPLGVNELIIEKNGVIRPGDHEDTKPKRGKKKIDNTDNGMGGAHTIKRIKSEIIVKQEPGYPDMHGRNIPFSPMPMPGSVPPDWTRLQSPSFSMQSPNKIQLGPATPATPGMVFQNPASSGSMLNMSSPRQMMMPGHGHPMMPPHDPTGRSGSAPYTPESVKNDKNDGLLMNIEGLYISDDFLNDQHLVYKYMDGTKDDNFEDQLVFELAVSPKREPLEGVQTLLAPGSTSSSNASTFTPPFDDIVLGNRPSH